MLINLDKRGTELYVVVQPGGFIGADALVSETFRRKSLGVGVQWRYKITGSSLVALHSIALFCLFS